MTRVLARLVPPRRGRSPATLARPAARAARHHAGPPVAAHPLPLAPPDRRAQRGRGGSSGRRPTASARCGAPSRARSRSAACTAARPPRCTGARSRRCARGRARGVRVGGDRAARRRCCSTGRSARSRAGSARAATTARPRRSARRSRCSPPTDYASNPSISDDGRVVVWDAYRAKIPEARTRGEIVVRGAHVDEGTTLPAVSAASTPGARRAPPTTPRWPPTARRPPTSRPRAT